VPISHRMAIIRCKLLEQDTHREAVVLRRDRVPEPGVLQQD
jgi:hypothetical protein